MAIIGAMVVSLSARIDALEKDMAKGTRTVRDFEKGVASAGTSAGKSWGKIDSGADSFRAAAKAMIVASSAMKAFGADTNSTTSRVLEMGGKIAGAFAIGGPWLAGIVAAAEAIGALRGEAERAKQTAIDIDKQRFGQTWTRMADATKEAFALGNEGKDPSALLLERIDNIKGRTAELSRMVADEVVGNGKNPFGVDVQTLYSWLTAEEKLIPLLEKKQRYLEAIEKLNRSAAAHGFDAAAADLREQLTRNPAQVAIDREIADAERRLRYVRGTGPDFSEDAKKEIADLEEKIAAMRRYAGVLEEVTGIRSRQSTDDRAATMTAVTETEKLTEQWRELRREVEHTGGDVAYLDKVLKPVFDQLSRIATMRRRSDQEDKFQANTTRGRSLLMEASGERTSVYALQRQLEDAERHRNELIKARSPMLAKELEDLELEIVDLEWLVKVQDQADRIRADRSLTRELDVMRAFTDEQRAQVELTQKVDDLRKAGTSELLVQQYISMKLQEPLVELGRGLYTTLTQGVASGLVDGLTNGWRNAESILQNIVRSMLTMTVNSLVSTVGSGLISLIGGGGGGGDWMSVVSQVVGGVLPGIGGATTTPLPGGIPFSGQGGGFNFGGAPACKT